MACCTPYLLLGAQSFLEVLPRNELVAVAHRGAYLYVWVRGKGVRGTYVMHVGVNEESVFFNDSFNFRETLGAEGGTFGSNPILPSMGLVWGKYGVRK